MVVGAYNGHIHVYDTRSLNSTPVTRTADGQTKHMDAIWEVQFLLDQDSSSQKTISFCTCSRDGKMITWSLDNGILTQKLEVELRPELMSIDNTSPSQAKSADKPAVTFLPTEVSSRPVSAIALGAHSLPPQTAKFVDVTGLLTYTPICATVHPSMPRLMYVGTEEGKVISWSPVMSM